MGCDNQESGLLVTMAHLYMHYQYTSRTIYDTDSKIDAKLIKLPQIDISIFDKNTFRRHINEINDISYL